MSDVVIRSVSLRQVDLPPKVVRTDVALWRLAAVIRVRIGGT